MNSADGGDRCRERDRAQDTGSERGPLE